MLSVDGNSHYHVNAAGRGENIHDWPAAKAALDALVSEERGKEFVEVVACGKRRVKRDGSEIEKFEDGRWVPDAASHYLTYYRKGREVALEETSGLRDAARELVEAVFAENRCCHEFDHAYMKIRIDVWDELVSAARKLSELLEG